LAELISNTSPLQYLHQLGQLELLRRLSERVIVPPAVVEELAAGKAAGFDVPVVSGLDWIMVRSPLGASAERLVADLGRGETQVLMLALESPRSVAVLDDAMARRVAITLGIKVTGTLGLLLDSKAAGFVPSVKLFLDRLEELGFWVSRRARILVLRRAGEEV
jgi:predicted nucleic acid-binding protein